MLMPSRLEEIIGVTFHDPLLLQSAFVHRSFMHEHPERVPGLSSNERLEFLGDAVLNFLTAAWLFVRYPDRSEGELTSLRSALVKTTTLAGFARELNLGTYIRISRGEDTPAARNRDALLADIFEAVLGAIYLDQGVEGVALFVTPFLERQMKTIEEGGGEVNYRTRLQEVAQARYGQTPAYQVIDEDGPAHQRVFTMEVRLGEQVLGIGRGLNKQAAAQSAAQEALHRLAVVEDDPA
ncbi:ribonuclease III [Candidatus Chloroploca sp. Khr17]|uniref:ribonuclease III n=1 Tax=Candidatus Chloroploca sp. Khr17 TaxID=2496869 RepID=UPI001F0F5FD7|nr:ribonuclease III [Candidatus Chloroploca sp. Khr17]